MITNSLQQSLVAHLDSWRLKRFTSDTEYFAWQRQALSSDQLTSLHRCIELKRQGAATEEVAFYDATAHPHILPVLYSQRYDYYLAIGPRVASRIDDARNVLDFGCGVGILTMFYARQRPDKAFVGIDRSPISIARAREQAMKLGLENVQFICLDLAQQPLSGSYDLIIATHALVQAEHDPGLPSRDWRTFKRGHDSQQQQGFEARTGVGLALDRLCAALASDGRMFIFEKTRQLARRVPLQRALAARGCRLIEQPELIRYQLVEEVVDDGPFYVIQKRAQTDILWDESPEPDNNPPFNPASVSPRDPDTPLYENHGPSAQLVWERLPGKQCMRETTRQEADGRQLYVELGKADDISYLYCANTFDQRQLVIVRSESLQMLITYYEEIVSGR